jgi:hypothetical protein
MNRLSSLSGVAVCVLDDDTYPNEGEASVVLLFADGTKVRAAYWRVITDGRAHLSSFDHGQQYGLPAAINARDVLRKTLNDRTCLGARLDTETGDLSFEFDEHTKLQVFNFTGYEIWEIAYPDGTIEYSNYALATEDPYGQR